MFPAVKTTMPHSMPRQMNNLQTTPHRKLLSIMDEFINAAD
jgi:hypothetical protein